MKALFCQDTFIRAWNFASLAHKEQKLPGSEVPYINHIGNVTMEVIAAITAIPVDSPDLAIQCALLHDVIEDTDMTFDQFAAKFGPQIAAGVMSLSKDKELPSKQEQILDSLKRIKEQAKEVWMVKLADRITNLQPPPHYWNKEKISNYRKEAILIHDALKSSHVLLADRLAQKIENYKQYID